MTTTFDWRLTALDFADRFIAAHPAGSKFTGSDLRVWSQERGCPVPNSQRAWGGVVSFLRKAGRIRAAGFVIQTFDDRFCSRAGNRAPHVHWEIA